MQSLNPLEIRTRLVNRERYSSEIPANRVSQVSEGKHHVKYENNFGSRRTNGYTKSQRRQVSEGRKPYIPKKFTI
jgi:hypothetical protein